MSKYISVEDSRGAASWLF